MELQFQRLFRINDIKKILLYIMDIYYYKGLCINKDYCYAKNIIGKKSYI